MARIAAFAYGIATYVLLVGTLGYIIAFLGNFGVPKTIDSGTPGDPWTALAVNVALLGLFGLQHSGMARRGFKAWWARILPPRLERNTFNLATCVAFWILFALWQPLPQVVWEVHGAAATVIQGIGWLGWTILLLATFMVNHFELFGLSHAWNNLKARPEKQIPFRKVGFYHVVRHPIQLGVLIGVWATPVMTVGHLVFAGVATLYILVALQLEERDLLTQFGDTYADYRRSVPMLLPLPGRKSAVESAG